MGLLAGSRQSGFVQPPGMIADCSLMPVKYDMVSGLESAGLGLEVRLEAQYRDSEISSVLIRESLIVSINA